VNVYYRGVLAALLVTLLALACFLAFFFVWVLAPVFAIVACCVYLLVVSHRRRGSPRDA
jgi:hypothetical protein